MAISTDAATTTAESNPAAIESLVNSFTSQLVADVGGRVLDSGVALWSGLAAIVIAWQAMKIMLTARWSPGEIVQSLVVLTIPRAMLWWYETPLPGTSLTLPQAIVSQGAWLTQAILDDGMTLLWKGIQELWERVVGNLTDLSLHPLTWIRAGGTLVNLYSLGWPLLVAVVGIVAMAAIAIGQILWAGFGIAMCSVLGPLAIPWLIFSPMSFLFWGWFRTLLIFSLYAPIAAAVLRVFVLSVVEFALFMVSDWNSVTGAAGAAIAKGLATSAMKPFMSLVIIMLVLVGLLATIRVPTFAASLISGSGAGGIGEVFGTLISTVTTVVGGKAAVAAATKRLRSGGG